MDPGDSATDVAGETIGNSAASDQMMRADINANKSIISKVEKIREIRASKIQTVIGGRPQTVGLRRGLICVAQPTFCAKADFREKYFFRRRCQIREGRKPTQNANYIPNKRKCFYRKA